MKYILTLLLLTNTCFAQTLYVADSMEIPGGNWRGISTTGINSLFTGGLSPNSSNPFHYPMYASYDSCYMIKGIGTGSSTIEVDTFIYPNLPLTLGRRYQIRYKIASFGLDFGTQTAAGVDQTDWIELQYTVNNGLSWWRDAQIQGYSNAIWSFSGALGTNAMLNINRISSNSTAAPAIYVSNASNPIVNVWVTMFTSNFSTLKIRFVTNINASGECFLLDDVQVWDVTSTLPIDLIDFYGRHYGENIKLFWTTACEINNDYFIIYKSFDGINYDELDRVSGAGNSNVYINYRYLDNQVCDTIVYYKLRQIDYDGKYTESDPIAIQCREKDNSNEIKGYDLLGREINNDYNGIKIYK